MSSNLRKPHLFHTLLRLGIVGGLTYGGFQSIKIWYETPEDSWIDKYVIKRGKRKIQDVVDLDPQNTLIKDGVFYIKEAGVGIPLPTDIMIRPGVKMRSRWGDEISGGVFQMSDLCGNFFSIEWGREFGPAPRKSELEQEFLYQTAGSYPKYLDDSLFMEYDRHVYRIGDRNVAYRATVNLVGDYPQPGVFSSYGYNHLLGSREIWRCIAQFTTESGHVVTLTTHYPRSLINSAILREKMYHDNQRDDSKYWEIVKEKQPRELEGKYEEKYIEMLKLATFDHDIINERSKRFLFSLIQNSKRVPPSQTLSELRSHLNEVLDEV